MKEKIEVRGEFCPFCESSNTRRIRPDKQRCIDSDSVCIFSDRECEDCHAAWGLPASRNLEVINLIIGLCLFLFASYFLFAQVGGGLPLADFPDPIAYVVAAMWFGMAFNWIKSAVFSLRRPANVGDVRREPTRPCP